MIPKARPVGSRSCDKTKRWKLAPICLGKLERLEVRAAGLKNPIATAIVTQDREGRLVPLSWSNAVTEPVFFPDVAPTEASKVLTAINEHVPSEAVILAWWDLSRRIRSLTQRQAPLDDPLARGLLTPSAWSSSQDRVRESQTALWGAGVLMGDGDVFARFVDALLLDEAHGAEALAEIAGRKPAYIAVHLSDIWKAAAARPDRISIAYRDFPAASDPHGAVRAVSEWIREQKIEGGYAVERIGGAIRNALSPAQIRIPTSCLRDYCRFRHPIPSASAACASSINIEAIGSMN